MAELVEIKGINKFSKIDLRSSALIEKPLYGAIKRWMDVIFGSALLVLLGILIFPVLAVLIKLGSRGPVFFTQKRTGKNGKVFNCIKFRSMIVNKEADMKAVEKDDKRITKVGKFMRRFYLDELPQLYNVLRSEMSLVGPRPHMLMHDEEFGSIDHRYKHRQIVKPGITGLAQVKGLHGSILTSSDLHQRIDADLLYIKSWSLKLDIKILFQTLLLLFIPLNKRFGKS